MTWKTPHTLPCSRRNIARRQLFSPPESQFSWQAARALRPSAGPCMNVARFSLDSPSAMSLAELSSRPHAWRVIFTCRPAASLALARRGERGLHAVAAFERPPQPGIELERGFVFDQREIEPARVLEAERVEIVLLRHVCIQLP